MGYRYRASDLEALNAKGLLNHEPARFHDERAFMEWVCKIASAHGWCFWHCRDSRGSAGGWPDLSLFHPVRRLVLFRELKLDKGKTTTEQEAWLAVMSTAGADAGVWRPNQREEILRVLRGE